MTIEVLVGAKQSKHRLNNRQVRQLVVLLMHSSAQSCIDRTVA